MPVLNRARVVDIQFDQGRKVYQDQLLDLRGENGVVILQNGGGKTLLVQLLLQVIKPNTPLNNRRFGDLFRADQTSHLLLEWDLDGKDSGYLLTGITASLPADGEALRYFTYIHHYYASNHFDIAHIPVVKERRVTPHQQFLRLLREAKADIRIFETNKDYWRELETFNIFADEWDALKRVNDEEGAAEGFFSGCSDVPRLFRKVLIPAVLGVIYPNDDDSQGQVARAFSEYYKRLVNIPRYKEELAELEGMKDSLEGVLKEVNAYGKLQAAHQDVILDIQRLRRALEIGIPEKEENIKTLQEQAQEAKRAVVDLKYRQDSLSVHETSLSIDQQRTELQRIQRDLEATKTDVASREEELNYARAQGLKKKWQEDRGELRRHETRLDQNQKEHEEIYEGLRRHQAGLLSVLPAEIAAAEEAVQESKERLSNIKTNIERLEGAIVDNEGQMAELQQQEGALKERINEVLAERKRIEATYGWEAMHSPDTAIAQRQQALAEKGRDAEARQQELLKAEESLEETRARIAETAAGTQVIKERLAALQDRQNELSRERDSISGAVTALVDRALRQEGLYSPACRQALLASQEEAQQLQREAIVAYHRARAALSLGEDDGPYLPNEDMRRVQETLDSLGVAAVPGGEWAKGQFQSEEERMELLADNPLLPYGLIITPAELRTVERRKEALEELSLQAPVPLFADREELMKPSSEGEGVPSDGPDEPDEPSLTPIGNSAVYVVGNRSFRLHVSDEALQQHRAGLQDEADRANDRATKSREAANKAAQVLARLDAFYERYPEGAQENLADQLRAGREEHDRLQSELERAREDLTGLTQLRSALGTQIQGLEEEQRSLGNELAELQQFRELKAREEQDRDRRRGVADQIQRLKQELREERLRLERIKAKALQLDTEISGGQLRVVELQRELASLEELDLKQYEAIDLGYEELKARIRGFEESLETAHKPIADLTELCAKLRETMEDRQAQITDLGFTLHQVEAAAPPEHLLAGLRAQLQDLQGSAASLEAELTSAKDAILKLESRRETLSERVRKDFGRDPADDFDATTDLEIAETRREMEQRLRLFREDLKAKGQLLAGEQDTLKNWERAARETREILLRFGAEDCSRVAPSAAPDDRPVEARGEAPGGGVPGGGVPGGGVPGDVNAALSDLLRRERNAAENLERQKSEVKMSYNKLASSRHSYQYKAATRVLVSLGELAEDVLLDATEIEGRFRDFFSLLAKSREQLEQSLATLEADLAQIEEKALREATRLYEELSQIDGYSSFRLDHRRIQTLQITLGESTPEQNQGRIARHLEEAIRQVRELPPEDVEDYIAAQFRPEELLNAIAPIARYRVRIFKPEHMLDRLSYDDWANVPKWSGGERFTAYFMTLVSLLSYLRAKRVQDYKSSKLIIADNPFGKASSPHLLQVVFGLARETGTQMLCLTDIRNPDIYEHFPVVYSLVLNQMQGKQYVQVNEEQSQKPAGAAIGAARYTLFDEIDEEVASAVLDRGAPGPEDQ